SRAYRTLQPEAERFRLEDARACARAGEGCGRGEHRLPAARSADISQRPRLSCGLSTDVWLEGVRGLHAAYRFLSGGATQGRGLPDPGQDQSLRLRHSTDGAIARTVADAAAGLDAMAGHLPGDAYWSDVDGRFADAATPTDRKLRIGFTVRAGAKVEDDIAKCVRDVARLLEGLGHRVTEGGPDTEPFRTPMQVIVVAGLGSLPITDESKLEPFNALGLALAKQVSAIDYVRSVDAIRMHSRIVVAFWDSH